MKNTISNSNSNSKRAAEYFEQGYNCAQAVFLVYAKNLGMDRITALRLSSSFGGGMGRLREVCGAVTSMFAIAGLKKGYTESDNDDIKEKHYTLIQNLAGQFKDKHGSIICRELLNLDEKSSDPKPAKRTKEYYGTRPCKNFIETACDILDNMD